MQEGSLGEITVQLTDEDYIAALKLHSRDVWKPAFWFLFSFTSIVGIYSFLKNIDYIGPRVLLLGIPAVVAVAACIGLVGAAIWYLFYRNYVLVRMGRRIYKQQRSMQTPGRFFWSKDGFQGEDELAVVKTPWNNITKWRENETIFMFYVSDLMFHVIPKRAFTEARQLSSFRDCLPPAK